MDAAQIAPRPRRNPLVKAVCLLLAILVLVLGGACLIPTLMQRYFVQTKRSPTPEDVRRVSSLITDMSIPDGFEPDISIEVEQFGETTRAARWRHKTDGGTIICFELPRKYDPTETVDVPGEVARFQFHDHEANWALVHMYGAHESEEVEIRGEKVDFAITVPHRFSGAPVVSGKEAYEVTGVFPSKSRKLAAIYYSGIGCDRKALSDFLKSLR